MLFDRKASKMNRKKLNIETINKNEEGEIKSMVVSMERADSDVKDEGTKLTAENLMNYVRELYEENVSNNDNQPSGTQSGEAKANCILDTITLPTTITGNLNLPGYNLVSWQILNLNTEVTLTNGGYVLDVSQLTESENIQLRAICAIDNIQYSRTYTIGYISLNGNILTWNQTSSTTNSFIYWPVGIDYDGDVYIEVFSGTNLISYSVLGQESPSARVKIQETEALKNTNKINSTDTFTFNVRVCENSNRDNVLRQEEIIINYNYYSIPDFEAEITQDVGNIKSVFFTIMPYVQEEIYVEVLGYNNILLTLNNPTTVANSNAVRFGFTEKSELNNAYATGPLEFEFNVRISKATNHDYIIGVIPGKITYNFTQIRPID